jgi:hypothetical protein
MASGLMEKSKWQIISLCERFPNVFASCMRQIPLEIETHDRRLGFSLLEAQRIGPGTAFDAPGGVRLECKGILARKALDITEILKFVVDLSLQIDINLFAAWLYGKVQGSRVTKIVIERREIIEITEDRIRQVLEEVIESSRDD